MKTATENAGDIRIPHSRQAEAAVLGAMIMSREGQDIALEAGIDEKCIYSPDYVKIFRIIMTFREHDKPIDPITVSGQLVEDKNYGELRQEVAEMTSQFTTAAKVEGYVHLLRELSIRRGLIATCQEAVSMAGNVDATTEELISCLQNALDGFLSRNAPGTISDAAGIVEACIQHMERVKFETGLMNVPSGYAEIDEATCGWAPGDMIVLAARPSEGKTALALNFALNAVQAGKKVAFFSAEMEARQIGYRILASKSGVNGMRLRGEAEMTDEEWRRVNSVPAMKELRDLFIDDTPAISTAEFSAKARRLRRAKGVDLIIVDYMQLMRASESRKNGNREQDVSSISKTLKATAKKLEVPVIALAQLSRNAERAGEDGPKLSDLRESGAIEQDSDIVILASKDQAASFYGQRALILNIAKNRNGVASSAIRLSFDASTMRFSQYTPATMPGKVTEIPLKS